MRLRGRRQDVICKDRLRLRRDLDHYVEYLIDRIKSSFLDIFFYRSIGEWGSLLRSLDPCNDVHLIFQKDRGCYVYTGYHSIAELASPHMNFFIHRIVKSYFSHMKNCSSFWKRRCSVYRSKGFFCSVCKNSIKQDCCS